MKGERNKMHHLYNRLSIMILCALLVVFAALCVFTTSFTKSAVLNATYSQLGTLSTSNGNDVQSFMKACESSGNSLLTAIIDGIDKEPVGINGECKSAVYPELMLSAGKNQLETFMISLATNTVTFNDDIIGMGIMFEPYEFTKDRESYALYFTDEGNGVVVSDVGPFAEFSLNEYYQVTVGASGIVYTEPYEYREMPVVTCAIPMIRQNKQFGAINVDVTMNAFQSLIANDSAYKSMRVQVINGAGELMFDSSDLALIGQDITATCYANSNEAAALASLRAANQSFSQEYTDKSGSRVCAFYSPIKAGSETWYAVTTVATHEILSAANTAQIVMLAICVIALLLIVIFVNRALYFKLRPIGSIVKAAKQIAGGDLQISLDNIKTNDEIGQLAMEFDATCAFLNTMIRDISSVLERLAHNDLTVKPQVEYIGDFAAIRKCTDDILKNLGGMVSQINQSAANVYAGANQISQGTQQLSAGAMSQSSAMEHITASIADISGQTNSNALSAKQAKQQTILTMREIEKCNEAMTQMTSAMDEIKQRATQINHIVRAVEDIAFQTNILSLNASVEAARAGDAGKGFTVVAEEVRELAGHSSEAVSGTTELVGDTIKAVDNGAAIAEHIAQLMSKVVNDMKSATELMDKIESASASQAQSVGQITESIESVSRVIQTTSATAQENTAAGMELSGRAGELKKLVDNFVVEDSHNNAPAQPYNRGSAAQPSLTDGLY